MRKACLDMVHDLARRDPRVVYVGSDPAPGTLAAMKAEFPDRHLIEGIAEQNIIGLAAGLAMEGFIPYVNTIATFLTRRCFEQVAVDLCLHKLPVRLLANGGGMVYAPLGPTHLAIEDMAIMRALPNMTVVAPSDAEEMKRVMAASLDLPGPMYVRFGKGGDPVVEQAGFTLGRAAWVRSKADVILVSTGVMTERCLRAADLLKAAGIACGVLHVPTIKPLDAQAVLEAGRAAKLLVTVEEHVVNGGLGTAVAEVLIDAGGALPVVKRLGLADAFTKNYGSQDDLLAEAGLQPEQLADTVKTALGQR